jgi:AcrR family transcriptional regulator
VNDDAPRRRRVPPLAPDDRRAALIAATLPLLRAEGLGVSTRQIAQAAGVAEGTIFRVFPDKAALIGAALECAFDPAPTLAALRAIPGDLDLRARLIRAAELLTERVHANAPLMVAMRASGLAVVTLPEGTGPADIPADIAGGRPDAAGPPSRPATEPAAGSRAGPGPAAAGPGPAAAGPGPAAAGPGPAAPEGGEQAGPDVAGCRPAEHGLRMPNAAHQAMQQLVDAVTELIDPDAWRLRQSPYAVAWLLTSMTLTGARAAWLAPPPLTTEDLVAVLLDGVLRFEDISLRESSHAVTTAQTTSAAVLADDHAGGVPPAGFHPRGALPADPQR